MGGHADADDIVRASSRPDSQTTAVEHRTLVASTPGEKVARRCGEVSPLSHRHHTSFAEQVQVILGPGRIRGM